MWLVVAGSLGAAITAVVTAYLGRRSKSGRIETSEAKDLWDTLRAELARLQAEAIVYRAEIAVARQEMDALRLETAAVRHRIAELEAQLVECAKAEKMLRSKLRRAGIAQ